ncbi:MAG: hypothetical protein HC932_00880 [Thermales bacterium]|nr:hypothetical protein [Thermales bacterium]
MTLDLIKRYQSLGVDDPANVVALNMSKRWLGEVSFPFIFEAFKYLTTYGYGKCGTGLEMFTVLIYFGSLVKYSVKDIMLSSTIDHIDSSNRAIVRTVPNWPSTQKNYQKFANNSDLLRLGLELQVGLGYSRFTQSLVEEFKYGGNRWDEETINEIKEEGFKPTKFLNHGQEIAQLFLDILKEMDKQEFEDYAKTIKLGLPDMRYFISDGYDQNDESNDFALPDNIEGKAFGLLKGDNRLIYDRQLAEHQELYQIFQEIYNCIGFRFRLTSTDDIGVYKYSGIYQGRSITGLINQSDHFCQLNTVSDFTGILRPRSDKEDSSIQFDLIHILRLGTDYHGG